MTGEQGVYAVTTLRRMPLERAQLTCGRCLTPRTTQRPSGPPEGLGSPLIAELARSYFLGVKPARKTVYVVGVELVQARALSGDELPDLFYKVPGGHVFGLLFAAGADVHLPRLGLFIADYE